MVFMISHERCDRKPYALPVPCVPYVGMSDAKIRCLANKIIEEMIKRKMKIAGSPILLMVHVTDVFVHPYVDQHIIILYIVTHCRYGHQW